jgi:cytochrome b561
MSAFAPIYDAIHSPLGVAVLFLALVFGMWNMYRKPPANLSQKVMRWRVGLQFAVICAILGMVLLKAVRG